MRMTNKIYSQTRKAASAGGAKISQATFTQSARAASGSAAAGAALGPAIGSLRKAWPWVVGGAAVLGVGMGAAGGIFGNAFRNNNPRAHPVIGAYPTHRRGPGY